jgi:hypothetical protein
MLHRGTFRGIAAKIRTMANILAAIHQQYSNVLRKSSRVGS